MRYFATQLQQHYSSHLSTRRRQAGLGARLVREILRALNKYTNLVFVGAYDIFPVTLAEVAPRSHAIRLFYCAFEHESPGALIGYIAHENGLS